MLKKMLGLTLSVIMTFGSLNMIAPVSVSGDELSDYEKTINSFDPEYVMWTNQMIDEGFADLSPNQSNKEDSTTTQPYGDSGVLKKWAEYEFLWTHGYPVGNGRMAAVVMGGIDKEVIQINEDTVWAGSPYVDSEGNPTSGTTKDGWKYYRGANADGTPAEIGSDNAIVGPEEFRSSFPAFANKSISNMALNVDNSKTLDAVQGRHDIISMVEKYFLGNPKTQKAYQSFVETYLDFGQKNENVKNYYKALNMKNASVTVEYDYGNVHYKRETIASYPAQTVATNIKSEGGTLDFNAELHTFLNGENPVFTKVSDNQIKVTAKVKDGSHSEQPGNESKIRVEARLLVDAPNSQISVSDDNTKLIVSGGNEATVYVVGASNYVDYLTLDDTKPAKDCDKYISNVIGKTYAQIKAAHEEDYKELFDRSYITLENNGFDPTGIPTKKRVRKDVNGKDGFSVSAGTSPEKLDKAKIHSTFDEDGDNKIATLGFNYGKYLMIAGSRDANGSNIPMSQPLNLTGKWNPSLSPSWSGKYTININTEMNYWLAQPLNLAECEKPLLDVFKDLAESGSITAKEQYGIYNDRGDDSYREGDPWVMHHNFDLWRGTMPIDNATAGVWPTGGVWLLDHAWQYYLYNNDKEYLSEFYPIMKGAASFFTQFLVIDPKTGYLVTAASCSPEQGSIQPGAAMDTQLIRNLYDSTIKAAEILGKNTEDAALIAKMKEQLPENYMADEKGKIAPNLIDKGGYINEWARGDVTFDFSSGTTWTVTNPFTNETEGYKEHKASNSGSHRHCSHLWELFPGTHVNPYSEDEHEQAVFKAFQKTVTARSPGDSKGWALAWRTALSARALDGNAAYARVKDIIRSRMSPNMFGQHPNFQIDCNYGFTAGITEMLLQSNTGTIDILPALPDKWSAGQFKGFKARGNVEVGAKWKKGIPTRVDIKAIDGGEVKVRSPYMGTAIVKDVNGNEVTSRLESNNTVIAFTAEDNAEYTISGFGEIPQQEGTVTEEWKKTAADAGDFFNDGTSNLCKVGGNNAIGTIFNNLYTGTESKYNGKFSGKADNVGFSFGECELDNLKTLMINMASRVKGMKISIRKGSKDGDEIASKTIDSPSGKSSFVDEELTLTSDTSKLTGKAKLFVVLIPAAADDIYLGDVAYLKGTREVTFVNKDCLSVKKGGENYIKNAITPGNYTFTVDFDKLQGLDKAYMIIAYYDDDTLISETKTEISKENNSVTANVDSEHSKYTMRVIVWKDLDSMQPVRDVKEFV